MSDTRVILAGVGLIFAGFTTAVFFGDGFATARPQAFELGECYDYKDDGTKEVVDCTSFLFVKSVPIIVGMAVVGVGVFFLVKGARGKWDQEIADEDLYGPKK